jgi:hypothetical protein
MEKVFNGGIIIPLGITRSPTRLSSGGRVILLGITNSWTRNLPEVGYFAGNHQFMDKKQTEE